MDHDRNWNRPFPDPRLHLENGSFVLPVENTAVNGGVNSMAYFNISLRSNDHRLFSSEVLNYREANTGTSHDPYLHPLSAGSSSRVPPNYVQHRLPSYNQLRIGGTSSTVHPQMDNRRASFKRKTPDYSMAFDGSSSSGYYSAGSSSNPHVSSSHLQPKPMPGPQRWPGDLINNGPNYGTNNPRNVRSRTLHQEINPSGTHPWINQPHHNSTANTSGPTMAGQWSQTPVSWDSHSRILPSEIRHSSHEMNRSIPGSSMEVYGGYHSNPNTTRHPTAALPTLYGPSTRATGLVRGSYGQRQTPYGTIQGHRPRGSAATLDDGRRPGVTAIAPSRHSRPLFSVGRSSERIGRVRNIHDRFQPVSYENNARNGWIPEGVIVIDPSPFYGSRSLFNHHHEMGLNIDSMSYEELLALEERIGNVSTGLSEGMISKCLTEMTYCADGEEDNCVICLEEYKDKDSIGRLNCRHDFHFSCIKKWLLMKNVCPICKASASEDTKKEK